MRWLAAATMVLAAAAPAADEWVSQVSVHRATEKEVAGSDAPDAVLGYGWIDSSKAWVTPADLPARFRARALDTVSALVLEVDRGGRPTSCAVRRPSAEPSLDALACELLMKRARFAVRYEGPARPVAYRFGAGVRWKTLRASAVPAPVPPPVIRPAPFAPSAPQSGSLGSYGGWPRLNWLDQVRFGPPPAIQAAWPGEREGVVSLDIKVTPSEGVTACRIGVTSGSVALDEAACRAARKLELTYPVPCEVCRDATVPLKVVWKKKGSHIRLPLPQSQAGSSRNSDKVYVGQRTPLSQPLTRAELARIEGAIPMKGNFWATLNVDEKGRTRRCVAPASSRDRAVATRICELLVQRLRYSVRTDVFGDPVADTVIFTLDLAGLR